MWHLVAHLRQKPFTRLGKLDGFTLRASDAPGFAQPIGNRVGKDDGDRFSLPIVDGHGQLDLDQLARLLAESRSATTFQRRPA